MGGKRVKPEKRRKEKTEKIEGVSHLFSEPPIKKGKRKKKRDGDKEKRKRIRLQVSCIYSIGPTDDVYPQEKKGEKKGEKRSDNNQRKGETGPTLVFEKKGGRKKEKEKGPKGLKFREKEKGGTRGEVIFPPRLPSQEKKSEMSHGKEKRGHRLPIFFRFAPPQVGGGGGKKRKEGDCWDFGEGKRKRDRGGRGCQFHNSSSSRVKKGKRGRREGAKKGATGTYRFY